LNALVICASETGTLFNNRETKNRRRKDIENEDGKTKYTTRVCHWTVADRETHEKMGFHQGWSQCADQLETLVANL
jgi:uncharacterized protein YndB with AHSA1/START domain